MTRKRKRERRKLINKKLFMRKADDLVEDPVENVFSEMFLPFQQNLANIPN